MYAGGLLADLPVVGRPSDDFLGGMFGAALLPAPCSPGWPRRRSADGPAWPRGAAVIVVLGVSYTAVSTIEGIATGTDNDTRRRGRGAVLAVHLVNGVQVFLFETRRRDRHARRTGRRWARLRSGRAAHRGRLGGRAPRPLPRTVPTMSESGSTTCPGVPGQRRRRRRRVDRPSPGRDGAARPKRRRHARCIAMTSGFLAPSKPAPSPSTASRLRRTRGGLPQVRAGARAGGAVDYLTGRQFVVAMAERLHGDRGRRCRGTAPQSRRSS